MTGGSVKLWQYLAPLGLFFSTILSASDIVCVGGSLIDYTLFISEKELSTLEVKKGGVRTISTEKFEEILQPLLHSSSLNKPHIDTGGSAGIVAKTLGMLGAKVTFVSRSGTDENGTLFRKTLTKQHVSLSTTIIPGTTGRVLCCITPDGERSFLFSSGSTGIVQVEDLPKNLFQKTKLVHIEGYTIRNKVLLEELIKRATKEHVPISYDLGCFILVQDHKQYLLEHVLPYIDILIGNESEMYALFGSLQGMEEQTKPFSCLTVMLEGENGCSIFENGIRTCYPTKMVQAIDSTGAGDCFTAGFLFGWSSAWPLAKSIAFGQQLGMTIVSKIGTDLTVEELEEAKNISGLMSN